MTKMIRLVKYYPLYAVVVLSALFAISSGTFDYFQSSNGNTATGTSVGTSISLEDQTAMNTATGEMVSDNPSASPTSDQPSSGSTTKSSTSTNGTTSSGGTTGGGGATGGGTTGGGTGGGTGGTGGTGGGTTPPPAPLSITGLTANASTYHGFCTNPYAFLFTASISVSGSSGSIPITYTFTNPDSTTKSGSYTVTSSAHTINNGRSWSYPSGPFSGTYSVSIAWSGGSLGPKSAAVTWTC